MATERDATTDAELQAKAQLETIISLLARHEHVLHCDGDELCDLTDAEICDGLGYGLNDGLDETERSAYKADYHDEDAAREAIEQDALSVETRSGWHAPGEAGEDEEYCILLCTGGPAVRIIGELGQYGEATSARLQYQDWGTPWTEYITTREAHDALVQFAGFYVGF